jgi:hypothetical protein
MANDTCPDARRAQLAALVNLGPAGRGAMAARMSEAARDLAVEGELRRNPSLTRIEAERLLLAHIWGRELFARVEAHRVRCALNVEKTAACILQVSLEASARAIE